MAAGVPPPPLNSPAGSYYWLEWYTNLTNFLNGTNIPWSNLNFTGSNLTDIQTRNHNDLQNIQGGNPTNHYHVLGTGWIKGDGTSSRVPGGWSAARSAAGTYVITHNLGLLAPDYMAGATSNTTGGIVTSVELTNTNAFTVHVANLTSLSTAFDADVSFWLNQI